MSQAQGVPNAVHPHLAARVERLFNGMRSAAVLRAEGLPHPNLRIRWRGVHLSMPHRIASGLFPPVQADTPGVERFAQARIQRTCSYVWQMLLFEGQSYSTCRFIDQLHRAQILSPHRTVLLSNQAAMRNEILLFSYMVHRTFSSLSH